MKKKKKRGRFVLLGYLGAVQYFCFGLCAGSR